MQLKRNSIFRVVAGSAGVFALASIAGAQACPISTNGPDVIVGDIQEVANYSSVGSFEALALGTTSCNVGNTNLNWIPSPNVNHPVIASGLYKWTTVAGAGRFEQIGHGWIKHTFAAFQQHLCCTTCPNGNEFNTFSFLGVGCSDPYTGPRNGTQSLLGPRYQLNAHTGVYPSSNPHPSGGNLGRVQVNIADLAPNSASIRYFGEVQYLALDDARANNGDNNTSYREISVSGSGTAWTFGGIGATVRMRTPIDAWVAADPAVTLTNISVPEGSAAPYDGNARLVLGSRVTNIGGGQYHYEYALYNQNSDRSIRSFSLPVPAGVSITNIGFDDVVYQGADGVGPTGTAGVTYDGTDWAPVVSGGAITWSTQTFAVNQGANALRFATMYSFRFDANSAPTPATLSLEQFKVVNTVTVNNIDAPGSAPIVSYCPGTGCPCGNDGSGGAGCANSAVPTGALLSATGTPSVASDSLFLTSTDMTGSVAVFFQGASQIPASVVDDGLGCVGGPIVRLGTKVVGGGAAFFPDVGDPLVSVRGAIPPAGGTFYYQCFYRNAVAAFCPPATSNRTNGLQITWAP